MKFADWIEGAKKPLEIGQFGIKRLEFGGIHCEEFAPMRTRSKRRKLGFDTRQKCLNRLPVRFPSEVDRNAVLTIAGTYPKRIGGDSADFGDKKMRGELFA